MLFCASPLNGAFHRATVEITSFDAERIAVRLLLFEIFIYMLSGAKSTAEILGISIQVQPNKGSADTDLHLKVLLQKLHGFSSGRAQTDQIQNCGFSYLSAPRSSQST